MERQPPGECAGVARSSLAEYAPIVGWAEINEITALAQRLSDKTVQMVNSTAVGGGVAEILDGLVPLLSDVGVSCRWDVMRGGDDFFEVTKAFHNALHGSPYEPTPQVFDLFLWYNEQNANILRPDADFVVIHDPQPVGLIAARTGRPPHWIWRCHIDVSNPNVAVWDFLLQFIRRYDAALFSAPNFTQALPIEQYLFAPSIDPLSHKNRVLEANVVRAVLERFAVDPDRPIVTQISRFDRLKDPIGVIRAFKLVRRRTDCQLVLAGGGADDDPHGGGVLAEALIEADGDPDIHILDLPPWSALEINALQRGSTIIVQTSLSEGFGLTVTEALWKRKPVVASNVGGIPQQVLHKFTGLLTHSVEGTAYQIRFLLSNPDIAARLGENGHAHVKANYLITSNLKRYLLLLIILSHHR